jgi:hypothetical protein
MVVLLTHVHTNTCCSLATSQCQRMCTVDDNNNVSAKCGTSSRRRASGRRRSVTMPTSDCECAPRFACAQCTASFVKATSLKEHVKNVHGDRVYACNQCDKVSDTIACLCAFMGAGVHVRSICIHAQTAHTSVSASAHWAHTRHTCSIIDDYESEPFECDECHKKFGYKASVKKHKDVLHAADGVVYACTLCTFTTNYQLSLKNHMLFIHNATDSTNVIRPSV